MNRCTAREHLRHQHFLMQRLRAELAYGTEKQTDPCN